MWDDYKTTFEELQRDNKGAILVPLSEEDDSSSLHPHTVFMGEYGVFQLAMFSKLPLAVKFKRWVFEEVLPSIRGTGTYTLPSALKSIENVKAALLILLSEITKLQEIVMYRNPRLISVGNNTFILLDYKYERTLWV